MYYLNGMGCMAKMFMFSYGIRGKAKSSERALDDSQGFPSVLIGSYDSLWVVLTHRKLFLATWGPQSWARGQVAARMCWECVPNKVLLDSEGKLKLSEATVSDGSVASLWLKLFFKNMWELRIFVVPFLDRFLKYSNVGVIKGFCKGWI